MSEQNPSLAEQWAPFMSGSFNSEQKACNAWMKSPCFQSMKLSKGSVLVTLEHTAESVDSPICLRCGMAVDEQLIGA